MAIKQKLLKILSDGEWHSGEVIGDKLKITRSAVWKQLKQLDSEGLIIKKERGKGYRLTNPFHLLSKSEIHSYLDVHTSELLDQLEISFIVDSTNNLALNMINQHSLKQYLSGVAIFAEKQTQGKGRRGRNWISPLGCNFYGSIIWNFNCNASSLSGLSLSIGIMIAKALESLGCDGIEVKWPNDITWKGRKLGGILVEIIGDISGPCQVVIGIGINLNMSQNKNQLNLNDEIGQPWVDLYEITSKIINKNLLAANVLNKIFPMLANYEVNGFADLHHEWIKHDSLYGKNIYVKRGDKILVGIANGVDDSGALLLKNENGEERLIGGEVTLNNN